MNPFNLIPSKAWLIVAAVAGVVIFLRIVRANAAADALAKRAAAYAADRARRSDAGRKAADKEMSETRLDSSEDIIARIRAREDQWK